MAYQGRSWQTPHVALVIAGFLFGVAVFWQAATIAQVPASTPATAAVRGTAVLAGTVTADRGEVRALRVQARDTIRKIRYVVYTNQGQYAVYNLPEGTYEVRVLEEAFDSPTQTVRVPTGGRATANVALTMKPGIGVTGAQRAGVIPQHEFRGPYAAGRRNINPKPDAELMQFDQLYPPHPGRDLLMERCFGCHGPVGWHRLYAGKTREQWAEIVEHMFVVFRDGVSYSHVARGEMPDSQKQLMIDYLASNFGPNSKSRDLKTDPLVRDEEQLSKAVYITYEGPSGHDVVPGMDPRTQGTAWLASGDWVVQVDYRNPDPVARVRKWQITDSKKEKIGVHGIIEANGYVYWTERQADHIGALDLRTGKFERYPTFPGGGHTLIADSKGNVYYTMVGGAGRIGRLDAKTRQIKEWEVKVGANWYGIIADKQDRIWAAGTSRRSMAMYDPKTDKWTLYSPPVNVRRITLDSKGNIWANSYFGNMEIMLDPKTGKFTQYPLPLKNGAPYEGYIDPFDTLWVENAVYNSFVKLDPATKKWTYYPFPVLNGHAPKLNADAQGTLYSGLGGLTLFKPTDNVPVSGGR